MTRRSRRTGIKATELVAELQDDAGYRRKMAASEAERQVRTRAFREAEQPIVADLCSAGVQIESVWDLVNTSEPYPDALPVLMDHLERGGYPDRVMESLGRALAVKPSVAFWERLKRRWLDARSPGEEDGAAVALASCATKAQLDDLITFLSVDQRGRSRIYFLRPILKTGGNRGLHIVETLRQDSIFGEEATALLKKSNATRR